MISKNLTITKRLGRYHNLPINNNNNNNNNSSFQSHSNQLESLYKENVGKSLFDWNKPLLGYKSSSLQKLLAKANKTTERATKFINKIRSRQLASVSRARSIPENATIRKEYIKCGKEMCQYKHGPYYYAYWKDPETKKLKKKYIGDHMPKKEGLDNNSNNNQIL
jgi:hypothetical protein